MSVQARQAGLFDFDHCGMSGPGSPVTVVPMPVAMRMPVMSGIPMAVRMPMVAVPMGLSGFLRRALPHRGRGAWIDERERLRGLRRRSHRQSGTDSRDAH